jgi:ABC-type branched-subunit amino acid transport system substrate-binding protein/predicted negative regulator of RcsB-dependent stress response
MVCFDNYELKMVKGTMGFIQFHPLRPNRQSPCRCTGLRSLLLLSFLAAMILCSACAQKQIHTVPQPAADSALFSTAERLFEKKSYREALAAYQAYLAQYPRNPMADSALMKMGMIYSAEGDFQEERRVLQRLIADYPGSPYVPDARISVLFALFREGEYALSIQQANALLKSTTLSRIQAVRIYSLLGDIYSLIGPLKEALGAYVHAFERAESAEQATIWKRFQEAISKLESADIKAYAASPPAGAFGGTLLLQMGQALVEAERNEEAITLLTRMVQLYPNHAKTPQARSLLETLSRKTREERYAIGCLLPLTGAHRIYGEQALKGIELALSQVSENNDNIPFQIIIKDMASDPDKAAAIVKELCEAKVAALIGPVVNAGPAAEAAQKCGIPIITLTGKEGIPDIGDYVFRNFITPQMQIDSLVPYATRVLGLKRFAVLYPDEKYGTTLMNLFWDKVLEYGGTVTGAEAYKPDAKDFSVPIEKLVGLHFQSPQDIKAPVEFPNRGEREGVIGSSPEPSALKEEAGNVQKAEKKLSGNVDFDAIFIPDVPGKVGLILPQLAYYDVDKVQLLGTNLWHSKELIQTAGEYLEHAVLPDGFFVDSELPQVKAFVEAFQAAYNSPPGFIEAISFDTAMMLFNLVNKPDILTRSALRDAMAAIGDYPGVTGRTSVLSNGDVGKSMFLLEISAGRFHVLQSGN